ncbi:hypothetical protein [Streptomyces zhihengii]
MSDGEEPVEANVSGKPEDVEPAGGAAVEKSVAEASAEGSAVAGNGGRVGSAMSVDRLS